MKNGAGILVYRRNLGKVEVLMAHPGGPFWKGKNENSWSIIKGESRSNETAIETALREFKEETGLTLKKEEIENRYLTEFSTKDKKVKVFTIERNLDEKELASNYCSIEYPANSGKNIIIPENDEFRWFSVEEVEKYCFKTQKGLFEYFRTLDFVKEPELEVRSL